ncbi:MAG: AEC family transporter [Pseudomonadota bacterium]
MIVFDALGPVFLLVMLGALFRRFRLPGGEFWPQAERLTYFVFFPALLVHTLANAAFTAADLASVFLVVLVSMSLMALLLWLSASWLAPTNAAFTSVFQGSIRINTYVGLASASGIWGVEGLATAALAVACMVPLVNLFCVGVFALKLGKSGSFLRQVAANPLIIACATGIALNFTGIALPGWSDSVFEILGRPALPLGLLAIGVGLSYRDVGSALSPLLKSALAKLLVMPLLAYSAALLLGLPTSTTQVLVLFFSLPTASSAYILARQMGGDAPLMATLITAQTLLAMMTMPLVLLALGVVAQG